MSEKNIRVFNPKALIKRGSSDLMQAAANPENEVYFRAGRMRHPDGRTLIRSDTKHGTAAYGDAALKVYRLVEVPEDELPEIQRRLDNQHVAEVQQKFDTGDNNG